MSRPLWDACTPPQRDVLVVLARTGWSNELIGRELGITADDVKYRLRGIYNRTKITKRSALVMAYLRECHLTGVSVTVPLIV